MAPEQIDQLSSLDARADIHALGAVLFFMLAGRPPFEAASFGRLLIRITEAPPPSLCALRGDVPPALDLALQRALAKRPEQRYPDVHALGAALRDSITS
jgi:serine/threonine protein kinase